MVQLNLNMEQDKGLRTKVVTYWIIDTEDQQRQVKSHQIRRWSKFSAIAALLMVICGLVATTFVWSRYGLSIWKEDSKEIEGRTAILVLHILGPAFVLIGLLCFIVACVVYEFRGKDNSTLTFDPGAQDAV